MTFSTLSLIAVAGLAGPVLSLPRRLVVPVVVGELLAGVALGQTGARLIDANDPTTAFLGDIGFAMLMLGAGMHVPLRNRALVGALRRGAVGAVVAAAIGVGLGLAIAHGLGIGHPMVWAILLATGSAAIVLPGLEEAGLSNPPVAAALLAMAWATVADVATVVAVPLVLQPSKAGKAALGAVAVVATAVAILVVARVLRRVELVGELRKLSAARGWALDLRFALVALFALCALADGVGTSIMIAGFAAGLIVAVEGGPKRLSDQVTGVAGGFFVPIFFVVLGARLDARALVHQPKDLALVVALVVGCLVTHIVAGRVIRAPLWVGLTVTAQLGVPAAIVKLGLADKVITSGQGAAIVIAALGTLGMTAAGTSLGARETHGAFTPGPAAVASSAPVT